MTTVSRLIELLACLSIVLIVGVACSPPATPVPPAAPSNTITNTVWHELLGDIVAGGPDGAGGLALETAGGEQRMLFSHGGNAQ